MSVFAGEQPGQAVTMQNWCGSRFESVYQVAAIYTAIMGFFMKHTGTEHARGSCALITLD